LASVKTDLFGDRAAGERKLVDGKLRGHVAALTQCFVS
jgi:hypothetical protein